jgi:hypothetical protein
MTRSFAIAALAAVALASCGKEEKKPVTREKVIAEAGELAQPLPGQYETKVQMLEFSIPGLPADQVERMKSMMGNVGNQTSSYCLTAEDAKKGFAESVRKMGQGQGGLKCDFNQFDVDGAKIAAQMTCTGQQGLTSEMKLDGTATARSTSMHMAMTQKAPMIPGGEMRMKMQMDSRRTGDCSS